MIFENIVHPTDIDNWIENGISFQLIDITDENLMSKFEIQSDWIPARKLIENTHLLRCDVPLVLCCHRGESSFMLMNILYYRHNFQNVYSLKSGILGWKEI
jgi:rhodanese-related sulfurtransferase